MQVIWNVEKYLLGLDRQVKEVDMDLLSSLLLCVNVWHAPFHLALFGFLEYVVSG